MLLSDEINKNFVNKCELWILKSKHGSNPWVK